jgi:phage baseplate assembly protein W
MDDPDNAPRERAASDYAQALAGFALPAQTAPFAPSDPYGLALTFSANDFVLATGLDGFADLALIAGKAELAQGIQILVATNLGSDIFNVAFGFDLLKTLATATSLPRMQQLIRLCVVKALSQEPRIRQINAITFVGDAAWLKLHPEVTAADQKALVQEQRQSRKWSLDVQFDTRLNDKVIAGIQGVGP